MLVTGAGFGLTLSALNTDALNRVPDSIRGQASGIIQTFRNFGSAVGMAVMGTIIAGATEIGGGASAQDFADAMETAYYVGAGMLAAGFLIARTQMPSGRQEGVE
jgi:MFS family permease